MRRYTLVMFMDERDVHLNSDRPLGPACGFKFPAYAVKYGSNMWKLPGGQSSVDFCWSDLGAVGFRGDPVDVDRCLFRKQGRIFNCNGHFKYQLPSISWKDIQNAVSNRGRKFFIKFSEIDFSQKKETQADEDEDDDDDDDDSAGKSRRRRLLGKARYHPRHLVI